ncbi:MAG: hypothetical protein ACLRNQ_26685 [Flavonifractor plautii]
MEAGEERAGPGGHRYPLRRVRPLRNLGLLILDEEQESTYKSENVPKYHARDVAKYRCAQNDALLVLGSATPSVESMYHAKRGTTAYSPCAAGTTSRPCQRCLSPT